MRALLVRCRVGFGDDRKARTKIHPKVGFGCDPGPLNIARVFYTLKCLLQGIVRSCILEVYKIGQTLTIAISNGRTYNKKTILHMKISYYLV